MKLLLVFAWTISAPLLAQQVEMFPAMRNDWPMPVDSNSPMYWRDGLLHVLTSTGTPQLARGSNDSSFDSFQAVELSHGAPEPMWIESVWEDPDGTIYGWYHHEQIGVCPTLTVPAIGAVVSYDGGESFLDLGLVLHSGDAPDCSAENGYFAGGHGDFTVILDREWRYFYFLFGNYGGPAGGQGIAMARMPFESLQSPSGSVRKYYRGKWNEPGLGGRVTPVFPAAVAWQRADADSFWGPSIHWNTHIERYVVVMNRSCCEPMWPQEGVYLTMTADLADPGGWSPPVKILEGLDYYPQLVGQGYGGIDREASQVVRLYVRGVSEWELVFRRDEELPVE